MHVFGAGILDAAGAINRRALAARVFADPEALGRLNALVHPRVREEEARRARALEGTGAVLVTDAALLVESGLHLRFDRLVVVDCRPEQQVRRLAARDGMTDEAARARLAAQMPVAEKRRFAHFLIDASASVEQTDRMTDELTETLRGLAARAALRVAVPVERALGALRHGPARGPRGLTPALLLREIVEAGGLEMERVSARLAPPPTGPWYRAASAEAGGPGPETLAVPVALFSLARRGHDPEYTAAAAASVGRLTHREPRALGDAVLMALALAAVASGGLDEARRSWSALVPLAERWADGPAGGSARQARDVALRHASDAAAARAAAPDPVGPLAGALVGMATGLAGASVPSALAADVAALVRLSAGPGE